MWTFFPHESLLNLCASKTVQHSAGFLSEICGQFSCMNPYWICAHLKLVKIRHKPLLKFVHNFCAWILTEFVGIQSYSKFDMNPYWICVQFFRTKSLLNLLASKATQNWTWILTEYVYNFSAQNAYWICWHLKLLKIGHQSLLNLCTIFPHKSLLNFWASKIRHNSRLNFWTIFHLRKFLFEKFY